MFFSILKFFTCVLIIVSSFEYLKKKFLSVFSEMKSKYFDFNVFNLFIAKGGWDKLWEVINKIKLLAANKLVDNEN